MQTFVPAFVLTAVGVSDAASPPSATVTGYLSYVLQTDDAIQILFDNNPVIQVVYTVEDDIDTFISRLHTEFSALGGSATKQPAELGKDRITLTAPAGVNLMSIRDPRLGFVEASTGEYAGDYGAVPAGDWAADGDNVRWRPGLSVNYAVARLEKRLAEANAKIAALEAYALAHP